MRTSIFPSTSAYEKIDITSKNFLFVFGFCLFLWILGFGFTGHAGTQTVL
jgi:hypothetical protein